MQPTAARVYDGRAAAADAGALDRLNARFRYAKSSGVTDEGSVEEVVSVLEAK